MICSFRGAYSFLSNFYEVPVEYNGIKYNSAEGAYQAQKTNDVRIREIFANSSPSLCKKMGRGIKVRDGFEQEKVKIMYEVVSAKFEQNPELALMLMNTGNRHIEEGNNWKDTFWGAYNGIGENNLGKILMKVRKNLLTECQN